jgi:hypothetical protein
MGAARRSHLDGDGDGDGDGACNTVGSRDSVRRC